MTTRHLLNFGTATSLTFWLSTIIAGFLHQNYNHISDTVSELGALGTRSHDFMTAATWLVAAFGFIFFIGLVLTCGQLQINVIPALTTTSIPFSFAWVAIFPAGTIQHPQGGIAMFSLYIGMILTTLLWKDKKFRAIRIGRL